MRPSLFSTNQCSTRRPGLRLPMRRRTRIAADARRLDRSALQNLLHEVALDVARPARQNRPIMPMCRLVSISYRLALVGSDACRSGCVRRNCVSIGWTGRLIGRSALQNLLHEVPAEAAQPARKDSMHRRSQHFSVRCVEAVTVPSAGVIRSFSEVLEEERQKPSSERKGSPASRPMRVNHPHCWPSLAKVAASPQRRSTN
jgi:hypothetical protein